MSSPTGLGLWYLRTFPSWVSGSQKYRDSDIFLGKEYQEMARPKKGTMGYLNKVLRSLRSSVRKANVTNTNVLKQVRKVRSAAAAVRRSVGSRM